MFKKSTVLNREHLKTKTDNQLTQPDEGGGINMSIGSSVKEMSLSVLSAVGSPLLGDPLTVFKEDVSESQTSVQESAARARNALASTLNWGLTAPVRAVATPVVVASGMAQKAYETTGVLGVLPAAAVGAGAGVVIGSVGVVADACHAGFSALSMAENTATYAARSNKTSLGLADEAAQTPKGFFTRVASQVLDAVEDPRRHPISFLSQTSATDAFEQASNTLKTGVNEAVTAGVVAMAAPVSTAIGLAKASAQKGVLGALLAPSAACAGWLMGSVTGLVEAGVMGLKAASRIPSAGLSLLQGSVDGATQKVQQWGVPAKIAEAPSRGTVDDVPSAPSRPTDVIPGLEKKLV
jgi:hypothetical protein